MTEELDPVFSTGKTFMRQTAIYIIIICVSTLIALNPITVYLVERKIGDSLYIGLLDLCIATVALLGLYFIRTGRPALFYLMLSCVVLTVPAMIVGELAYVYMRNIYGDRILGVERDPFIQPHPVAVYTLEPNVTARDVSPGNFDAVYHLDEKGRKKIEQNPAVDRTIHFFGDSVTFGSGVDNAETALNLLAERIGDRFNVQNYGVPGYSLEQMYVRLLDNLEEVDPGDIVIFSPITNDLGRSPAGQVHLCSRLLSKNTVTTFPRLAGAELESVNVRAECDFLLDTLLANTTLRLSLGWFYRSYRFKAVQDEILEAADNVFLQAGRLAKRRGAGFHVIFLTTARNCAEKQFSVDIAQLRTPYRSLMPHCPDDPDVARRLSFPRDPHWNAAGHAWAAAALEEVLGELQIIGPE